jgi:hypothetical protein
MCVCVCVCINIYIYIYIYMYICYFFILNIIRISTYLLPLDYCRPVAHRSSGCVGSALDV